MKCQALISLLTVALLGAATWRYQQILHRREEARRILVRSLDAGQRVSLAGDQRVEIPGAPVTQARLVQSADGKTSIMYLSGPCSGMRIWDNGRLNWRWDPKRQVVEISACRRRAGGEETQGALLQKNFTARLVGRETVAGCPAYVLELRPKEVGQPWKRLWVSEQNYAVLATADFGADGRLIQSTHFEQVSFAPPEATQPATFEPPIELVERYGTAHPGDSVSGFTARELVDIVGFPVRLPTYLPSGYEFQAGYPFPCKCQNQAARLHFTNGVNTILLFECGHNCPAGQHCVIPKGSNSLVVQLRENGLTLAATGDAPREQLDRMLRSAAQSKPVASPKKPGSPPERSEAPDRIAAGR
jgi:hypothetical protein